MSSKVIQKDMIVGISIYKFFDDLIRCFLGLLLVIFNFDLRELTEFLSRKVTENHLEILFNFLNGHIRPIALHTSQFLAISLILLSVSEVLFLTGLLARKKWGAIGMFIMQFVWVPIDLLIVSKLFLFSKIIMVTLWLIILGFMIKLLISPKGYFKK